jgi:hypothetical protein
MGPAPFNRETLAAFVIEPGLYPKQKLYWGFGRFDTWPGHTSTVPLSRNGVVHGLSERAM